MCQLSSRLITNWPNGGWSNNWPAHANNLVLVKFEVKVRAGLNIARTSSSVDLTAGLGRDELGWLPPRLTFDADGRSAGEAAAGAVGWALKASRMRLNCSSVSR